MIPPGKEGSLFLELMLAFNSSSLSSFVMFSARTEECVWCWCNVEAFCKGRRERSKCRGATLVLTDDHISTELRALKWTLPSAGSLRGRAGHTGEGYGNGECPSECSPLCCCLCGVGRGWSSPSTWKAASQKYNQSGWRQEKSSKPFAPL